MRRNGIEDLEREAALILNPPRTQDDVPKGSWASFSLYRSRDVQERAWVIWFMLHAAITIIKELKEK